MCLFSFMINCNTVIPLITTHPTFWCVLGLEAFSTDTVQGSEASVPDVTVALPLTRSLRLILQGHYSFHTRTHTQIQRNTHIHVQWHHHDNPGSMLIIRKKQESCILKSAGEKSTKVCLTPHHKSGELGQIMSLGLLLNQVGLHFSKERRIVW